MCAAGRAANVMLAATASLQRQPAIQMHGGLVQIIGSVHRLGLAVWLANPLWQPAERPEPFPYIHAAHLPREARRHASHLSGRPKGATWCETKS